MAWTGRNQDRRRAVEVPAMNSSTGTLGENTSDFTFKINLSYNDVDVVMANTVV